MPFQILQVLPFSLSVYYNQSWQNEKTYFFPATTIKPFYAKQLLKNRELLLFS
jgi:hypothetical protein